MSTRITITTVFLIGLTCGVILGLWLASLWLVPQPPTKETTQAEWRRPMATKRSA